MERVAELGQRLPVRYRSSFDSETEAGEPDGIFLLDLIAPGVFRNFTL